MLTKDTPVIALVARDAVYEKTIANIGEIKARGSPVIAIAEEGDENIYKFADYVIHYPKVSFPLFSIPIAVILQLLAYHAAKLNNRPIDKPRNLAKSVTVE